jgi:hypothetical protein
MLIPQVVSIKLLVKKSLKSGMRIWIKWSISMSMLSKINQKPFNNQRFYHLQPLRDKIQFQDFCKLLTWILTIRDAVLTNRICLDSDLTLPCNLKEPLQASWHPLFMTYLNMGLQLILQGKVLQQLDLNLMKAGDLRALGQIAKTSILPIRLFIMWSLTMQDRIRQLLLF